MTSTNTNQATQVDVTHHTTEWHTARNQARRDRHRRAPRSANHRVDGELPGQLGLFDDPTTDQEAKRCARRD